MKIVLYGATGNSGQRILQELTHRGHEVTAVVRNTSKAPSTVKAVKDDLSNIDAIASVIAGSDVVVSAYAPPQDNTDALLGVTERQIAAVKKAGVSRLIVVGGAGLLEVAPGVTLIASGYLPEAYLPQSLHRMKRHWAFSRDRISTGPTSARLDSSSPVSAPASTASERRT
jgi:putative NADH-flavin reductase